MGRELIRNSNRIITPADGKPFKENDPEEYIKRLHHFATGLGFKPEHLTGGDNPAFTSKVVDSDWIEDPRSQSRGGRNVSTEYGFDEGLITSGHMDAALVPLITHAKGYDAEDTYAFNELGHRDRMNITMWSNYGKQGGPGAHDLYVSKGVNSPHKEQRPVHGARNQITSVTGTKRSIDEANANAQDHINDVVTRFRESNRSRLVNPRGLELVNQAIANPSTGRMAHAYKNRPSTVSPQFLTVRSSVRTGEDIDRKVDEIDLKTGTWAKIDPDGYFPT